MQLIQGNKHLNYLEREVNSENVKGLRRFYSEFTENLQLFIS